MSESAAGSKFDRTLGELAEQVGAEVVGDPTTIVRGIATLDRAGASDLSFLTNPRYREQARASRAAALVVGRGHGIEGRALLVADDPYLAVSRLLGLFHPEPVRKRIISRLADVDATAEIGEAVRIEAFAVVEAGVILGRGVTVGSHCVVGENCRIGADSQLRPSVVLYPETVVGERCLIHSGVVLGADGFGFATSGRIHHKVPQVGRTVVEDDVELGANTTVDRGALEDTTIGRGSKLDDQVMIAHGVDLGPGSLVAAQAGIAGSTRVGAFSILAGQAGIAGHLKIADGTIVTAKSAVLSDMPGGGMVSGYPAWDHAGWKRSQVAVKKLPAMRTELRALRDRIRRLEEKLEEG